MGERMSLDVTLTNDGAEVYSANITHNLNTMAMRVGVYAHLWRPDEINVTKARHLVAPLTVAVGDMVSGRDYLHRFNQSNGWGSYDGLLEFIQQYRDACERFPDADVSVSR